MRVNITAALLFSLLIFGTNALAQSYYGSDYYGGYSDRGYTIMTPGERPTYISPDYGGGRTIMTPGQRPSYISPDYGGGYTITTPGERPTFIYRH